jgi:hypothetical protein
MMVGDSSDSGSDGDDDDKMTMPIFGCDILNI